MAPSHATALVLDIGGDTGALVVVAPPALDGTQIEISHVDRGQKLHNVVRNRAVGQPSVHAAVFPALRVGSYRFEAPAEIAGAQVHIAGGQVSWSEVTDLLPALHR